MRLGALILLTGALALWQGRAEAEQPGDATRGEAVFRKCATCHMLGPEARSRVGPPLNNILSAPAASVAGFRYSKAMQAAAADGLRWTPETLDRFLADPRGMIPKTRMSFAGLERPADRADVIAYLARFSAEAAEGGADAGFVVPPEVLALEGDLEYGAYLASECTGCHQLDGDNAGIPGIIGWQTEAFVTALHAYRAGHREHAVMQMIAGRLGDEEIAALAAYFKSLGGS